MRSYHLAEPGRVDGIVLRDHDLPKPAGTEILVRVRAAALNRRDAGILRRTYPLPSKPGVVPVSDGAGEVVAVGGAVTRFRTGDRVVGSYWPRWRDGRLAADLVDQLGCTMDGMLTEYALLDEQWAARIPDSLSWAEAAALPCAGVTAWTSLTGGERLVPGQTVLTLGTGDVSLFTVQLAKTMGCRVVSTTSSAEKADRLKALGADHVVDYRENPQWWQAVRDVTGGEGADLVVETVGLQTMDQSVRASALYGQIVLLRASRTPEGGSPTCIEISNEAYAGSLATIRRVFVGSRTDLEALIRAVDVHGLRPVIDREFGFDDAWRAFEYYLAGDSFGKVVIRME